MLVSALYAACGCYTSSHHLTLPSFGLATVVLHIMCPFDPHFDSHVITNSHLRHLHLLQEHGPTMGRYLMLLCDFDFRLRTKESCCVEGHVMCSALDNSLQDNSRLQTQYTEALTVELDEVFVVLVLPTLAGSILFWNTMAAAETPPQYRKHCRRWPRRSPWRVRPRLAETHHMPFQVVTKAGRLPALLAAN